MAVTDNAESLGANSSRETRSVFYCPKSPEFTWDLNHTTSQKITLSVTTIACPVTILLNLLVIIAVKTRRELKKNSNILLSRLAVIDLLVGAVSMPLTITLDALVLQRILFVEMFCTIDIISVSVLGSLCYPSFLHLVLIAWERYVAVVKWMKYTVLVTAERLKKYAMVAWLLTLILIPPVIIMKAVGVRYELVLAVEVILSTFWVMCFLFIIYCYVKVYLAVRRQNRTQISSVNALVQRRLERKIPYTTFWITLFTGFSGVPTLVIYMFGGVWPFLLKSSMFRLAETMFQLNSLVNPLLYCYRNRQLRKAALELLRCKKPKKIQQVVSTARRIRQRRYSVASLNVEELQIELKQARLIRSESCGAVMFSETFRPVSNDTVEKRLISAPSKRQQCNKQVVTVLIEKAPRKKHINIHNTAPPKDATELKISRHRLVGKTARSTSMNENAFFTLTNCHQNAAEKKFQRSKSLPILSKPYSNTLDSKLNCY